MVEDKIVSIIIPFYNEEKHIGSVINSLPQYIDVVILVNDGSTDNSLVEVRNEFNNKMDKTFEELYVDISTLQYSNPDCDFYLIHHERNLGKGAAIKSGYRLSLDLGVDCIATIDGDGQMDIEELYSLCLPIIRDEADYVKGNRLSHPLAKSIIPQNRLIGIHLLTFLTRICSGYWHINDTQTGYTAISRNILKKISLKDVYNYYGYVNDVIVKLSVLKARIAEVSIRPIYYLPMDSRMNLFIATPKLTILMFRLFAWKLNFKLKSFLYSFQQN